MSCASKQVGLSPDAGGVGGEGAAIDLVVPLAREGLVRLKRLLTHIFC